MHNFYLYKKKFCKFFFIKLLYISDLGKIKILSANSIVSSSDFSDFFKTAEISFFFNFNLYIYPPDSQESAGGAIHRAINYSDLLPEMPRYCCLLVIFNRDMTLI